MHDKSHNDKMAVMAILEEINECVQETSICDGDVVVLTNIISFAPNQEMSDDNMLVSDGSGRLLVQTTKLSHNVYELEKNFQYNLYLLRSKDAEIIRMKSEIENYSEQLKIKEYEHSTMLAKYSELSADFKSINDEKERVRAQCRETMARLLHNMEELKNKQEGLQRGHRQQEKKREVEWQERLHKCEVNKEQELTEINDWLAKERVLANNLQTQIQSLAKENIALRIQYQKKQSSQISRISILETELKNKEQEIAELLIQLEACRKDCSYYQNELQKTIAEKDKAKQEVFTSISSVKHSELKLNQILTEKESLSQQLEVSKQELINYIKQIEQIMKDKDDLEKELQICKSKPAQLCMDPKHENIDVLVQQNALLQEVVKAMRRERIECGEMEKKVERLEHLVKILKTSMARNNHAGANAIDNPLLMGDNTYIRESV